MTSQTILLRDGYFNGCSYGKARCEIGWNWHPQPLSDYDLWYVVSGAGEMRLNGDYYRLGKGVCFLVRPGDEPHAVQDPNHRLTVIYTHFGMEHPTIGSLDALHLPPRYTFIEELVFIS